MGLNREGSRDVEKLVSDRESTKGNTREKLQRSEFRRLTRGKFSIDLRRNYFCSNNHSFLNVLATIASHHCGKVGDCA